MKTLGSFIHKKTLAKHSVIDQQSVFYVFQLVIKEEYGRQGVENIIPVFFKDKSIAIRIAGALWGSEILLKKAYILGKINKELGGEEIVDLTMSQ